MRRSLLIITAALLATPSSVAGAGEKPIFAVVVGVNRPINRQTRPLLYADDDAILFHRLMASVGRSTLLVDPDPDSRRLHSPLSARPPTRANLQAALTETFAKVRRARELGQQPQFYFIYSGHGDVKNNRGYLALSDGTLDSDDLARRVLGPSPAASNHVIVDACRSYYLVHEKRAGGQRRPLKGSFHRPESLARRFPSTGFLLSTSAAESSHEWAEFQAGIFSHEVRSGLLGAADANLDGRVTYDEIWAFIQVANIRIPNERFRPQVYLRPPRGDGSRHLLDMRRYQGAALTLPPGRSGRYLLEDRHGVRLADIHTPVGHTAIIRLPGVPQLYPRLYLHDMRRLVEYPLSLHSGHERVELAQLSGQPSSYNTKGAAHEAFTRIFEEPFGLEAYQVQLRCDARRMQATACPNYYCQRCHCEQCHHLWDEPGLEQVKRTPVARARAAPAAAARRKPWQSIVTLALGLKAMARSFDVNEPIYPAKSDEHSNYRSGAVPALTLEGEFFPGAIGPWGPLANLGLLASYTRSLGLKSQPPMGGDPVTTTMQELLLGARYRWNILGSARSPELRFGLDFGRLAFVIWDDQTNYVPLPDVVYVMLRLALVDLTVPLVRRGIFRLDARLDFDYRLVLSSGEIESNDSAGYGSSNTGGIKVGWGLRARFSHFLLGLEGFYERYFLDFNNTCYNTGLSCRAAGGAIDLYYGVTLLGGYQY